MKIEVELRPEDLEIYDDYGSENAAKVIFNAAIQKYVNDLAYSKELHESLDINIKELIKENKEAIIDKVVNKVSKDIARKKEIVAITPKAKDLAERNSENEDYFMSLIEAALKKKFG